MTTVRSGWNSTPYGRKKFDIELGEPDLVRVLVAHHIDPAAAASMPLGDVFRVLYCECEILARYAMIRHMTSKEEGQDMAQDSPAVRAVKAEAAELSRERDEVLARYPRVKAPKAKADAKT